MRFSGIGVDDTGIVGVVVAIIVGVVVWWQCVSIVAIVIIMLQDLGVVIHCGSTVHCGTT